jgi:amidase
MASGDLVLRPAVELSALIHGGTVSCREVMTAHLAQIDRLNPIFNAVVSLRPPDLLLAEADTRDAELAQGRSRGWMHGLPHAVKDFAQVAGLRTTMGSPLLADFVPDTDAIFVERLRAAGAILIGRTNVPEFGLGSHTTNPVFGVTRNAYDPGRSAGGSSGGASVALALRMVPVADGSDFAGSLRNPAGWANIFGMRPSAGRVPFGPTTEVFLQQIGYEGPMARHVTDLAMLLSTMAGYDDRAPLSLDSPTAAFGASLAHDPRGTRIGWLGDLGGIPMAPGLLDRSLAGLRRLTACGCIIEEATLGLDRETIWDAFVILRQVLLAGALKTLHADTASRAKLKPEAVWEIEGGLRRSGVELYAASVTRSSVYQAFRALLQRFDVLALPTAQVAPFDATLDWPKAIGDVAMDSYHRWMEIVAAPSLAGLPVISVPAGFTPDGLPFGVQIIGRNRADLAVLRLAHAYEQVAADIIAVLPPALTADKEAIHARSPA